MVALPPQAIVKISAPLLTILAGTTTLTRVVLSTTLVPVMAAVQSQSDYGKAKGQ